MKPVLVIISGAPGSGKTQLSGQLGVALKLPVISKDLIKETLMEALLTPNRDASIQLGRATFRLLYRISHSLLQAGVGVIVEAPFTAQSMTELKALALESRAVLIHCLVPPPVAVERYRSRFVSGQRPAAHFDEIVLVDLEGRIAAGEYNMPLIGSPTLEVNTIEGYRPTIEGIVDWVVATASPDGCYVHNPDH